jgi:hypothetical protein
MRNFGKFGTFLVARNFLIAHREPRDLSSNFLSPFSQSSFDKEQ